MLFQYINHELPEPSKILALFLGNRGYYCDRELIFGNNLFKRIVRNAHSADNIAAEIQKKGFTHLFIRYDLFNFWAEKQFSNREKEALAALFEKDLIKLQFRAGYGLFKFAGPGISHAPQFSAHQE